MGNLMRIAELEGQVERKDAYIDKLTGELEEARADRAQHAELSARLFCENEQLKRQVNDKQLEIDHRHAVCDELRQRVNQTQAQAFGAGCQHQIVAAATTQRTQDLERQLATIEAERDALAAQVAELSKYISVFEELQKLSPPQQHLAEIRAQAAKRAIHDCRDLLILKHCLHVAGEILDKCADQYADSIRQEKK